LEAYTKWMGNFFSSKLDYLTLSSEFWPRFIFYQNKFLCIIYASISIDFRCKKISPQSPKTEFGFQNQYGRIKWSRKNYLLGVKKEKIGHQISKDFRTRIPFLGSDGLFLLFWPPQIYFFLSHITFPIDRYITRPTILILKPQFRFWALMAYFQFWTPKSIYLFSSIQNFWSTYGSFDPFNFESLSAQLG
jgi:hypothetical protein